MVNLMQSTFDKAQIRGLHSKAVNLMQSSFDGAQSRGSQDDASSADMLWKQLQCDAICSWWR